MRTDPKILLSKTVLPQVFLLVILVFFLGILSTTSMSLADEKKPKSQKVIDFEGDLVEGMNRQPLDSLNQVSDGNGRRRKAHLYRTRRGFRTETQESIKEMRYLR